MSPERRLGQITAVLAHYPELVASGIDFSRIAGECCKRIPRDGIANGLQVEHVAEAAAEATLSALVGERPPRGRNVANYLVACFRKIAWGERDIREVETLSRVSARSELLEMRKTLDHLEADRATYANRKPGDPALPKAALARLRPRPSVEDFPTAGCTVRPVLTPPRVYPPIGVLDVEPLSNVMPADQVREYRDLVRADEALLATERDQVGT